MKLTKRQLRRIIKEGYNSMSPRGRALANSVKRKFMKMYPDAVVGIDGREGWITVNGQKAVNMSQASGSPMSDDEMIGQMHIAYAGTQVDSDVSTADSRMDTFREGKIKITRDQIRSIVKEAIDVINRETGEVLVFGDEARDAAPEAAVPDLARRLGLDLSPNDDSLLSNDDWGKLEAETIGKRGIRDDKATSARIKAKRDRLNIDNLLQKLRHWAEDAAREYMADNPNISLQDIAYDLADAWESEFENDEREELMWHFDDDLNDLKVYAAESMG